MGLTASKERWAAIASLFIFPSLPDEWTLPAYAGWEGIIVFGIQFRRRGLFPVTGFHSFRFNSTRLDWLTKKPFTQFRNWERARGSPTFCFFFGTGPFTLCYSRNKARFLLLLLKVSKHQGKSRWAHLRIPKWRREGYVESLLGWTTKKSKKHSGNRESTGLNSAFQLKEESPFLSTELASPPLSYVKDHPPFILWLDDPKKKE